MRISLIKPHSGEEIYFCDKVFGSSIFINRKKLKLGSASFKYFEVKRYPVRDCAYALKIATVAINETISGKWWKTQRLGCDECYKMVYPRTSFIRFKNTGAPLPIWSQLLKS